jgi:hypothetical protein
MSKLKIGDKVICMNSSYSSFITINKIYIIIGLNYDNNYISIKNDYNNNVICKSSKFISLKEFRKLKLNNNLKNE